MSKWLEMERIWKEEWKKEFPEDAKRLEESFQNDFEEMEKYGEDLEKLTKEFTEKMKMKWTV